LIAEHKPFAKVVILESPTGTGKSQMLQEQIRNNQNGSFLIVLNSVKLCKDMHVKLSTTFPNMDFKLYSDESTNLAQYNRCLVICVNSLKRLPPLFSYDYVIFDEVSNCIE